MFPRAGSRILDRTILPVAGSDMLAHKKLDAARQVIERIERFEKILVVSDMNIGDAFFTQAMVSGLRDFFPEARIDLAINKTAARIVEGNPEVTNVLPIFSGTPMPSGNDLANLLRITAPGNYDFILTMCPFFESKKFPVGADNIVPYTPFAAVLVNAFRKPSEIGHVIYQMHHFVHLLFRDVMTPRRTQEFRGVTAVLPEKAVDEAQEFLRKNGIAESEKIIMINPDASSRFTTIPFDVLSNLIKKLSNLQCTILLGSGFIDTGIEKRLLQTLTPAESRKIVIIPPRMPLEVYSAMIDFSAIYICGDTGPMHIAGARRYLRERKTPLRNKTRVFSIFGATPAKIYAYDSESPGFFPANQDAPSRVYVAESPCRNITCINKSAKTCKTIQCFEVVDVGLISEDIDDALILNSFHGKVEQKVSVEGRRSIKDITN